MLRPRLRGCASLLEQGVRQSASGMTSMQSESQDFACTNLPRAPKSLDLVPTHPARCACTLCSRNSHNMSAIKRAWTHSTPLAPIFPSSAPSGHHRSICTSQHQAAPESSDRPDITFPPVSAGGVILGQIQLPEDVREHESTRKLVAATIFDDFYQDGNDRTGRKQLARAMKGDYIGDYYLSKTTDPLLVNIDGQEEAAARAERNLRGFKRRRPEKKTSKGGKGGKGGKGK